MLITFSISITQIITRGKDVTVLINKMASSDINNRISDKISLIESIAELEHIQDSRVSIRERALSLRPFQEKYDFLMVALMDKDGNASSSLEGGSLNLSFRDYFKKSKATKSNVVSEVLRSRTTNEKNIVIIHPNIDKNNEFDGAIFLSIRLTDLIKLAKYHSIFEKGYSTTIIDENMNIIAGDFTKDYSSLKNDMLESTSSSVFIKRKYTNLNFVTFTKNTLTNWYVVTELNLFKSFIYDFINIIATLLFFIFLFVLIFKKFNEHKNTEIKPLMESLKKDHLTKLYNRNYLEETVGSFLDSNLHLQNNAAFIILDIDNFKAINDNLGHSFGDYVLVETSQKISDIFVHDSTVARMGGDEFLIFIENVRSESDIIDKLKTLLTSTNVAYSRDDIHVHISLSIGVTFIEKKKYNYIDLY
ncbi:MAG: diguanylate cyclase domain-containing protein, partial [Fusobacteriaceae bacterium]